MHLWTTHCEYWDLNFGPLKGQHALSTTETSLQVLKFVFVNFFLFV